MNPDRNKWAFDFKAELPVPIHFTFWKLGGFAVALNHAY